MRLTGATIADLGGDGDYQYTVLLAGITELGLKKQGLRLAIHLFEVMSYPDPADGNKTTAHYSSEYEFMQKRVKWPWTRNELSTGKKEMMRVGLLDVTDGNWFFDISVIPRNVLTSKRSKSEAKQKASEISQETNNKNTQPAKPLELPESDLTVINMTPKEVSAATVLAMDEATIRSQTFNQRQVAKQTHADEKGLREYNERQQQEEREDEENESPIIKLLRERQEKQEEEDAKERSITAGMSFVERTEYKRKKMSGEPQVTIQQSERELEFARRINARRAEDAEMRRFADWLNYSNDPRQIWDDRDEWGYQDFLESLKPKPEPEPVPAGVSSDVDDGANW